VHAGEALLAFAERQPLPPVIADSLPQAFGALVVERQLGVRQDERLTEGAPFAIGDLYRRLTRKWLVRHAGVQWDVDVTGRPGEGGRTTRCRLFA
jgi:hypothetical protein